MVTLVRAGRGREELSREFEPSAQSISNWVAQGDRDQGKHRTALAFKRNLEELLVGWPDPPWPNGETIPLTYYPVGYRTARRCGDG